MMEAVFTKKPEIKRSNLRPPDQSQARQHSRNSCSGCGICHRIASSPAASGSLMLKSLSPEKKVCAARFLQQNYGNRAVANLIKTSPQGAAAPGGATTPDGVDLGPTDNTKTFCLKSGTFRATTSVHQNTATAAQGRQDIKFEGVNTGKQEGKDCSCDCGVYRHFIRGYWRSGGPAAAKRHDITSCGNNLAINEGTFTEEYTSCIGDNDPDPCKWSYSDAPGWDAGLSDGTYVELRYGFQYQIWDKCQGKSIAIARRTLKISGDRSPRKITWET